MNPYNHIYNEISVTYAGIPFVVKGVIFYPAVLETEIDPPENSFIEWDKVEIGGVDISELCHGELGEDIANAVISQLER